MKAKGIFYVLAFVSDLERSKTFYRDKIGWKLVGFPGVAAVYIEEYGLTHGLRAGDAIIAATATEHGLVLCTGNAKHFNPIRELKTKIFKP